MNNKLSPMVFLFSLAAVVLGSVVGYFMPEFMLSISFVGTLFLNILKIIAIPFVITMIIAGVASMGSKEKVKRSLGKTAMYFTATSLSASVVGVLFSMIIQPGLGADKTGAYIPEEIVPHLSNFSFNNLFASFIPDNFLSASIEMQLFALTLVALILGAVLTTADKKNKIVLDFFTSLKEMLSGLMKFLIFYIAPIGLFSLAGTLFAENGIKSESLFTSLAWLSVTIISGLSFFALVLLPIIAKFFGNVSPYQYFTSLIPALSTAFATNSAVATLPVTEECIASTTVDQRASAFMLPLGSIFNATGTALFLSASAIFIAQMYGLNITIGQIFMIVGGSFLIASLASFIPYASLFMLALVLQIANFPIHVTAGIGILVMVDFLFGRLRSVVDVWSDAVGVAVLGNTFDFKTARSAKAAIPVKRTYNKSNPKTSRDYSKPSKDYPKTKRENKPRTQSKPTHVKKKAQEIVKDNNPSPFQISPEKNYLTETDNAVATPKTESKVKQPKSPVVKHSVKSPKPTATVAKESSPKVRKAVVKKDQPQTKRPKPIIHKIEVPPLPLVTVNKVKQEPVATVIKDEDSVITKANAVLSKDTIERERSKIAAQLNSMRVRESLIDVNPQESSTPPTVTKQKDEQIAKIDFYAEETPKVSEPFEPTATQVEVTEKKPKPIIHKIEVPPILTVPKKKPSEPVAPVEQPVVEEVSIETPVEQPMVEPVTEPVTEQVTEQVTEPVAEVPSPVLETKPVVEEVPAKKKAVSYGRKSAKKAVVKKVAEPDSPVEVKVEPIQPEPTVEAIAEPVQTVEASIEPEPTVEVKVEPVQAEKSEIVAKTITFGRGKRKK